MNIQELATTSLTAACEALLPAATIDGSGEGAEPLRIAAIIGFTSDDVRGTFGVAADVRGLERVRKHMGAGDVGAEDSLGEMANLLAGHVKRSFAACGQNVTITPPLVLRGLAIEVCGSRGARAEFVSRSTTDRVTVWLDCDSPEGLQLQATEACGTVVGEGEALLF